jgi:hypothetical protein
MTNTHLGIGQSGRQAHDKHQVLLHNPNISQMFTIFGDFLLALLIPLSFLGFQLRDLQEQT